MNRTSFGLHSDFMKLWIGQTVSVFGSNITRTGIPLIAVITLTATPTQLGILTAVASLPVLVLGLFIGAWVDRLRRRPIMIAADIARLLLLLTIPAAALTGHLSMELLYVMLALMGVLGLVFETAYRAYLPSLVSPDQIPEANRRLSTSDSLAEVGGPALAGALIQVISAPLAVLVDAATFLFSASAFALIRKTELKPVPHSEHAAENSRSVLREIAEGLRLVAHDPILLTLTINLGLGNFFGSFFGTLYDIYLIRDLNLTPAILGVTIAAGGVGALAGALLSSRIERRFGLGKTLIGSLLFSGCFNLLIPLASGAPLAAAAMLIAGQIFGDAAMMIYGIHSLSLVQVVVPNRLLGRTNASFGFIGMGIAPVGALLAGVLATALGTRAVMLIAVLGILATALWTSRSPLRKLTGFPAANHEPVAEHI
jgi:MFS family permease